MKYIYLAITTILFIGCYSVPAEKTGMEGKPIPMFKLLLQDSTTIFDTKDLPKGKPVVIFYYGPYCPYSRAQMEDIVDNMGIMKNIQFLVITHSRFSDMKNFYSHYHLEKYKNVIAGLDYSNFISEYFKVTGVPFNAIYSNENKLTSAYTGKIFVKQILNQVNP